MSIYACVQGFSPAFGHGNTGNVLSQNVLKALLPMLCLDWLNIFVPNVDILWPEFT